MMYKFLQSFAPATATNAYKMCVHALGQRNNIQVLTNLKLTSDGLSSHTTRLFNETRTNDNDVHCGPVYGQNLQTSSCQDAIAHIPNTDARIHLDELNFFLSCKPLSTSILSSGYIVEHW